MGGLFITFEGGEGSGKSTQIQRLKKWIVHNYHALSLTVTREPGGTAGAEDIRNLLVNGAANKWQPATEALMMSASRHEHVKHVIGPALARGDVVLCDRFTDSTHIYQGYVGGVSASLLQALDTLSCAETMPDLTLLLDIDSDRGLARTTTRGTGENRFEAKGPAFHEQVRQGFIRRAAEYPARIIKLDANRPETEIADDIAQIVARLFIAKGLVVTADEGAHKDG